MESADIFRFSMGGFQKSLFRQFGVFGAKARRKNISIEVAGIAKILGIDFDLAELFCVRTARRPTDWY
jgi:hypothetical protein